MRERTRNHKRRGLGMVEIVFSVVLVGTVMVAAMNAAGAAAAARSLADDRARGQLLAESLMTEILAQKYIDESQPTTMGPESGESQPSNRVAFDDVDDYRNYTDYPPKAEDGTPIAGFANWTRVVAVAFVEPSSPSSLAASDSGLKRITITVKHNGAAVATLVAFKPYTDPVAGTSKQILVQTIDVAPEQTPMEIQ